MKTILIMTGGGFELPGLEAHYSILKAAPASVGQEHTDGLSLILTDTKTLLGAEKSALDALRAKLDGGKIPLIALVPENCGAEADRCLEAGAEDIVYMSESAEIITNRLDNIILSYETAERCRRVERDPLTEAYTKDFFLEYMLREVNKNPDGTFDLICLEVESYDLIYGRYGTEICDNFMSTMVHALANFLPQEAFMGTDESGHIMFMMKHIPFEVHEDTMKGCLYMAERSPFPSIPINGGVYPEIERGTPAEEIFSSCLLAIESVRYNNDRFIAAYDDEIKEKVQRRKMLEKKMYSALQEKHFKVYYQPKYSMQGNTIHGAEALVRWIDPELGFMNPGEFIPLFEQNGFIFELDKFILETVCSDVASRLERGESAVPVSVNVSQTDFDQKRLDELFENIVDKYNIPHRYIHFEITESAEAPDALRKSIAVSGLRKRGFEVELDDFGAGYSTLSILKQMPVDVMKIDMSLIRNMFDPNYRAILEGALFTALKLNIRVVAEGVENEEQYSALKSICRNYTEADIQGFYFSKPLPSDVFDEKLSEVLK